ncbi:MAG: mannose-6-phosphate isomerase, class I [Saprospiraceae bacterium]
MAIYKLNGVVQHYAWGGTQFIPNLLTIDNEAKQPFAELWMGTHVKGPAKVETMEGALLLGTLIENAPAKKLGKKVAADFNNKLPFLFKVLDVNSMLSIQSHPTKKAAEIGFSKENLTDIAITAPNRTYRDDNHKPEVMVALTDFWLLHGFKSIEAIRVVLAIPEFNSLKTVFGEKGNIFQLYKAIMEMPQQEVNQLLAPLWQRLQSDFETGKLPKTTADYWAAQAFVDYTIDGNFDRGIFSIYLFNLVNIKKGDGIFQAAGIPHAYLEGVNMELMANSDNVFRGGLTQKHIDVPELLTHLVFDEITPKILKGTQISEVEKVFKTPAPDFELSEINLTKNKIYRSTQTISAETLIIMEGTAIVKFDGKILSFSKGESFFIEANTNYTIEAENNALLFKAKVP